MNLVHSYVYAYAQALEKLDIQELEGIYQEMENQAKRLLETERISQEAIELERFLDICYEGKRYYIETPLPTGELSTCPHIKVNIKVSFERLYEIRYGHLIKAPLRTINARLKATGKIKEIPLLEIEQGKEIPKVALKKKRPLYLEGHFIEAQIYEREKLLGGNRIEGPAIIEEPFHTTVVLSGQRLWVDPFGNLIIESGRN